MKIKRILLILSVVFTASVSAGAQDISKLENYTHFTAEQLKSDLNVVAASFNALPLPCKNYIEEITEVETAVCYEEDRFDDFVKKVEKLIKKAKIPLITASPEDIEYKTELYATVGKIIVVTQFDGEFASISIVHGTPPAKKAD